MNIEVTEAIQQTFETTQKLSVVDINSLFQFPELPFSSLHFDVLQQVLAQQIKWQDDSIRAYNREFKIPRRQAWFADDGLAYRYSDNLLTPQDWIEPLQQLRLIIQNLTGFKFNAVLATEYRDGSDHVDWHADNEPELGPSPVIASLSLGAPRYFEYRQTSNPLRKSGMILKHGDFLIMKPSFQHHWQHRVPADPKQTDPRINLTFRFVYAK